MCCVFRTVLRNTVLHTVSLRSRRQKSNFLRRDNAALSRVRRSVIAQRASFGAVCEIRSVRIGVALRTGHIAAGQWFVTSFFTNTQIEQIPVYAVSVRVGSAIPKIISLVIAHA